MVRAVAPSANREDDRVVFKSDPASGVFGNPDLQLNQLLPYVITDPPENQECSWNQHSACRALPNT